MKKLLARIKEFLNRDFRDKMVAVEILVFGRQHMHGRVLRKVLREPEIRKKFYEAVFGFLKESNVYTQNKYRTYLLRR